jgi:hypothetical protein
MYYSRLLTAKVVGTLDLVGTDSLSEKLRYFSFLNKLLDAQS